MITDAEFQCLPSNKKCVPQNRIFHHRLHVELAAMMAQSPL